MSFNFITDKLLQKVEQLAKIKQNETTIIKSNFFTYSSQYFVQLRYTLLPIAALLQIYKQLRSINQLEKENFDEILIITSLFSSAANTKNRLADGSVDGIIAIAFTGSQYGRLSGNLLGPYGYCFLQYMKQME